MKLITRDTDYAVLMLNTISEDRKNSLTAAELSRKTGIPLPCVRKILQKLSKKGPLTSYKGKGGGFELACPPEKILLMDIINLFQGPVYFSECLFKKKICRNRTTCSFRKIILELEYMVNERLKSVTIASLAKGKSGRC